MKENQRKCSKCGRSPESDPNIKVFRFPKPGSTNSFRCESWAKYCFPDKTWHIKEFQEKLYKEHRMLCSRHFRECFFSDWPDSKKKLHKYAVPDVTTDKETQSACESQPGPSGRTPLKETTNTISTATQTTHVLKGKLNQQNQTKMADVSESQPGPSQRKPEILVKSPVASSTTPQATHTHNDKLIEQEQSVISVSQSQPGSELLLKSSVDSSTTPQPRHTPKDEHIKQIITAINKDHDYDISVTAESATKVSEARPCEIQTKKQIKNDSGNKERKYYLKSRSYLKKICQLRKRLKKVKAREQLQILSDEETLSQLQQKISPSLALLLQGELNNFSKKPKGRRWTTDEKIIALRLYKRAPTCYRLLRRMFCLPAPSSLKKLLGFFNMPAGINKKIMAAIKQKVENQTESENEYVLLFDEMSIRKHFQYNKKNDLIDGYQDHGEHGRVPRLAVKALVFMLVGIRKKLKQPLCYYLSGTNVTGDRISVLIKEVVRECFAAGIKVSATVCDMGGTNRRALSLLGATVHHPVIKIDDTEIVAMYDVPHLLKCFRNMFMQHDILCETSISTSDKRGEGLAKWSDVQKFHEIDSRNPNFVFAPALRKDHFAPTLKQKMKVNFAAQVLSHTVAAGIFSKVATGEMPASAVVAAEVISNIDKLFDLCNSDTKDCRRGKPYATNMSRRSPHAEHFKKMKKFFQTMTFIGALRPPPSQEGWIWTINALEILWGKLQRHKDVGSLSTRRLQQDPFENLFGCIRGNCGSNSNPTTSAFVGGMKTAVMSNLAHISTGNCEEDNNLSIINNIKILLNSPSTNICTEEESEMTPLFETANDDDAILSEETGEMQACAYVCGFLVKHNKILQKCNECKNAFQTEDPTSMHNFVENKEYYDKKKCLKYSSKPLVTAVEMCALKINEKLKKNASQNHLKSYTTAHINDNLFEFLKKCPVHYQKNVNFIKGSTFHICIKRFCTQQNRKFMEKAAAASLKKKMSILKHS